MTDLNNDQRLLEAGEDLLKRFVGKKTTTMQRQNESRRRGEPFTEYV